jgi:hypothetical protein
MLDQDNAGGTPGKLKGQPVPIRSNSWDLALPTSPFRDPAKTETGGERREFYLFEGLGKNSQVEFPVTALADAGEDAILLRAVRPEVPLRREGKFWVYRSGEAPAPVEVAGMITAEREARSEAILPGSTALPTIEEGAGP